MLWTSPTVRHQVDGDDTLPALTAENILAQLDAERLADDEPEG